LDNSNVLDPNPDAIAEFRILTSDYTAEYGRNGGGVISIVTKSGTNHIHGSGFEFIRNRDFDANDYFNKEQIPVLPRLDLKRNQFGATLGGPIIKDKAFFFLAYQGQRQVRHRSPRQRVEAEDESHHGKSYAARNCVSVHATLPNGP
jgi:hypothetical protein